MHFASLDIRQESTVHNTVLEAINEKERLLPENYPGLNDNDKIGILANASGQANPEMYQDLVKDTLDSFVAIKTIQSFNGPQGCFRYVISQCTSALNVMEVFGLFLLNGWKKEELGGWSGPATPMN